jgi:nitroreductase
VSVPDRIGIEASDPERAGGALSSALFGEVLTSQRAVREFRSDAVPLDMLTRCIGLAVHAPSGSNRQAWTFIVIGDGAVKAAVASLHRGAALRYAEDEQKPANLRHRVLAGASGFADAPWIVVPCYEQLDFPANPHQAASAYGSIFPAIQNFLLACHASGLGACLTTMALHELDRLRNVLRLPAEQMPCAVIPVGWPLRSPATTRRRSITRVMHLDAFGQLVDGVGNGK